MKNRLGKEKSPYLLQHAENPVDWYPWGEEAFAKARTEHKPIFLSIGYSTCYWCHVMEKECFEREEVAAALSGFVAVKVDREEHPEVDEIYMDAVVAMTGHGGWPMSVFLTPDLQPFWGGTYIPYPNFLQLLEKISSFWRDQRAQLVAGGKSVLATLTEREQRETIRGEKISDEQIFARFEQHCSASFDEAHGGFGSAPKFPLSMNLRLLLRLGGEKNMAIAERSFEAMACGGIFDQLGGGFHRYSTDERWLVPHFEKMLYDNSLLAFSYLEAFQCTGKKIFSDVARATLDYLLRDMLSPEGAFFSAEDAGDVKREGDFYVFSFGELKSALGEDFEEFRRIYPVSQAGNFEHGTNILHLASAADWAESRSPRFEAMREKLVALRNSRKRPHRDEKILTAWNGLAISAFAHAGSVLGDARYTAAAVHAATWLQATLWKDGTLLRRYAGGEARYAGTAADYVYLVEGLLHLYQATFDTQWLTWARELQRVFDAQFWDDEKGGYFTASREEKNLVMRIKDKADGALPSPNSVACRNLIRLGEYFMESALSARAAELLAFQRPLLEKSPFGLAAAAQALFLHHAPAVLVVSGKNEAQRNNLVRTLRSHFHPRLSLGLADGRAIPILAGKDSQADCVGYLCKDKTCLPPMNAKQTLASLGG
ncbi:MAG: thioredoxin domain-containing protein [Bacteriovoracia bacterium]